MFRRNPLLPSSLYPFYSEEEGITHIPNVDPQGVISHKIVIFRVVAVKYDSNVCLISNQRLTKRQAEVADIGSFSNKFDTYISVDTRWQMDGVTP